MAHADVRRAAIDQAPFLTTRPMLVTLTLATAAIHLSLGGLLFTMNAVGYATLAVAMLLPAPIARFRWLVRVALLAFTTTTIAAWILVGARFDLAYIDKAIEVALVAVVALEVWLADGGPFAVARRALRLGTGSRL